MRFLISLTDEELVQLDSQRGALPRSKYIHALIFSPQTKQPAQPQTTTLAEKVAERAALIPCKFCGTKPSMLHPYIYDDGSGDAPPAYFCASCWAKYLKNHLSANLDLKTADELKPLANLQSFGGSFDKPKKKEKSSPFPKKSTKPGYL